MVYFYKLFFIITTWNENILLFNFVQSTRIDNKKYCNFLSVLFFAIMGKTSQKAHANIGGVYLACSVRLQCTCDPLKTYLSR